MSTSTSALVTHPNKERRLGWLSLLCYHSYFLTSNHMSYFEASSHNAPNGWVHFLDQIPLCPHDYCAKAKNKSDED